VVDNEFPHLVISLECIPKHPVGTKVDSAEHHVQKSSNSIQLSHGSHYNPSTDQGHTKTQLDDK
jgi:hypothetical protein